ncbi:hypothetical protein C6B36_06860 [Helicobacter cinaedi]|uniref:hypothetical protein n=1 Tax=Helicobacter cinaedi TaxID=213 RepID=UPI000CF17A4F|nr:hypothetical protein [Helicobacter cinaedi]AWK62087.1 hypothetical protein C6B36_06860 [Helicobacter cinaedi]QOQ95357.1 hypothetical protein HW245_06650 [Helicobacter cinaedi]
MFGLLNIKSKDIQGNVLASFNYCELKNAIVENLLADELFTHIGYVTSRGGLLANIYLLKLGTGEFLVSDGYKLYKDRLSNNSKDEFLRIVREAKSAEILKESLRKLIFKEA